MVSKSLFDKVFLAYEKERRNLNFSGFSPASINFFDDYPVEGVGSWNDANKNWYNETKKEDFVILI